MVGVRIGETRERGMAIREANPRRAWVWGRSNRRGKNGLRMIGLAIVVSEAISKQYKKSTNAV